MAATSMPRSPRAAITFSTPSGATAIKQRTGCEEVQRVKAKGSGDRRGLGQYSNALTDDAQTESRRRHQLRQPRGQPTLGRIVHRVDSVAGVRGREGGLDNTDSRIDEQLPGVFKKSGFHATAQPIDPLTGQNRGAFDGHPTGQQDLVATLNPGFVHQAALEQPPRSSDRRQSADRCRA